jgi:hypothetical protein
MFVMVGLLIIFVEFLVGRSWFPSRVSAFGFVLWWNSTCGLYRFFKFSVLCLDWLLYIVITDALLGSSACEFYRMLCSYLQFI